MSRCRLWLSALMLLCTVARAQDRSIAVVLRGNFTTESELFPDSDSPDPVARARSVLFEDILGAGIEIRYFPPGTNLAVGLSADYLRTTSALRVSGIPASVPAENGFQVVPVEVTGYFLIPVSSSSFGVYMGGGVGGYFGRRIYRIAGVEAVPLSRGAGFGIHVLGGVQLQLSGPVSLFAEMKFRDVQFRTTTVFPVSQTVYDGIFVSLDRNPRISTVHVDGVVFQIGTTLSW
jgi:hypothetical protein